MPLSKRMQFPRKIGVLTFHRSINYGSYWQARCLVEGIRARGFDAKLLDYDCSAVRRAEIGCALQPERPRRTPRACLKGYATKVRRFDDAVSALPLSLRFQLDRPGNAGEYDAIVVGSDEVWNFRHPWFGSKPIFFGDELRTERLVSYAASFGNHSAWHGIHADWARKLNRFSAVSVRDHNSWHLVKGGTGRDATLVLDPCLQFPQVAAERRQSGARHVIVYGHGFPAWLKTRIRGWADRRGVRLVSIGYLNDWADEQNLNAGPVEFAELMAGARAVVTNFFHGCVFALLNGKPWVSSPSAYRSIKIPDLVSAVGAERRLIDEGTSGRDIAELLETPVEPEVVSRIEQLRAQSDSYLDAALS
jgi:hypothetical protein